MVKYGEETGYSSLIKMILPMPRKEQIIIRSTCIYIYWLTVILQANNVGSCSIACDPLPQSLARIGARYPARKTRLPVFRHLYERIPCSVTRKFWSVLFEFNMQVGFTSSSSFEWHHVRKLDFIDYKLVWRFVTGRTNTSQHSPPTNHLLWPFEKHWMMNRWRGCTLWGGCDKRCVAMQRHDWNHQWPNLLCHLACTHHQDTFMSCCWDLLTKLSTHGDLRNWFGITWKEAVT